jgi:signal transduction histidine kinase
LEHFFSRQLHDSVAEALARLKRVAEASRTSN